MVLRISSPLGQESQVIKDHTLCELLTLKRMAYVDGRDMLLLVSERQWESVLNVCAHGLQECIK